MNRNANLAIIILLAILTVAVVAFFVNGKDDDSTNNTDNTEITNNDNQDEDSDIDDTVDENIDDSTNDKSTEESEIEAVSYSIDMDHLSFSPNRITAKPGQTVNLTLTSSDEVHDFVIDEFNANSGLVSAGGEKTFSFTIPTNAEAGDYEFYCSVGSHRQMGMVGTLTVQAQ
jgi:plastocyanin